LEAQATDPGVAFTEDLVDSMEPGPASQSQPEVPVLAGAERLIVATDLEEEIAADQRRAPGTADRVLPEECPEERVGVAVGGRVVAAVDPGESVEPDDPGQTEDDADTAANSGECIELSLELGGEPAVV